MIENQILDLLWILIAVNAMQLAWDVFRGDGDEG